MLSMSSVFSRFYSLFYLGVYAFCVVGGFGALMAHFYKLNPVVSFDPPTIEWYGKSNRNFEEARFHFNISADFSSCNHVNIRHFYSYILAEYGSGEKDDHKAILFDYLITRQDPKKEFIDIVANNTIRAVPQGASIKGKKIHLTFYYQMIPYIGFFRTEKAYELDYTMPNHYVYPPKEDQKPEEKQ